MLSAFQSGKGSNIFEVESNAFAASAERSFHFFVKNSAAAGVGTSLVKKNPTKEANSDSSFIRSLTNGVSSLTRAQSIGRGISAGRSR